MEHLIESVRKFPCLWRMDSNEYRDNELKEEAWREVVKECDLPDVKEAKSLWKKLRDGYRQATARNKTTTGQAATPNVKWRYYNQMEFLLPTMANRPRETNFTPTPMEQDTDEENIPPPASKQVKVRTLIENDQRRRAKRSEERDLLRRQIINRPSEEESSLKSFFLSMYKATSDLKEELQMRIQHNLFTSVMEARRENASINDYLDPRSVVCTVRGDVPFRLPMPTPRPLGDLDEISPYYPPEELQGDSQGSEAEVDLRTYVAQVNFSE